MKVHNPLPESLGAQCVKAASILDHFMKGTTKMDSALIPKKVLERARGIAILTVVKAGCLWSGRGGSGLVVARLPNGQWSAPSAILAVGVGVGAQFGVSITDIVFILNNEAGVRAFSSGANITLGGNVSVAAGPTGRAAESDIAAVHMAPIYSYSKSKGVYVGVTLEGTVIVTRRDANVAVYGKQYKARDILSGEVPPPAEAEPLYRMLNSRFAALGAGRQPDLDDDVETPRSSDTTLARSSTGSIRSKTHVPDDKDAISAVKKLQNLTAQLMDKGSRKAKPLISSAAPTSTTTTAIIASNRFSESPTTIDKATASVAGVNPVKKPPPPRPPVASKPTAFKKAVALYDFKGEQPSDLSFSKGDVISVTKMDGEWWTGSIRGGKLGEFPYNYVQLQ